MDDLGPDVGVADGFLEGASREREGGVVRVHDAVLRIAHRENLGKEIDDRTELALVLPDPVCSLLPILDVGPREIPAADASCVVAERGALNEKPAIQTITPSQARLHLPLGAAGKSARAGGQEAFGVIRVHDVSDQYIELRCLYALSRPSVVLKHGTVCIEEPAGSSEHDDVMRNEIEDLSKFVLPRGDLRIDEVLRQMRRPDRLRRGGRCSW